MRARRDHVEAALLAAIVAAGAFLRFEHLGLPSYWLDEILHHDLTTQAMREPWWRWIAGFSAEHGPLYYATQLAARIVSASEFGGRLPAAVFGVLTIPLVWLAARRYDRGAALAAALLAAVSPLHVYYSREARAYGLLLFLTAALAAILLSTRRLFLVAGVMAALLYASATSAPVLASALIVACVNALIGRDRGWWLRVAACALVALALLPAVYATKPVADLSWPGFPALDLHFFDELLRTLTVSATGSADASGRTALVLLAFALVGAFAALRRDRVHGSVYVGMALLPLALTLVSLRVLHHFYAARYITPALTGFLVLAAIGVAFVARLAPVALLVAVLIAAQTWTAARTEAFQKLDWRAIAATIAGHARPGDLVVAAEPWSEICLRFYFERTPHAPELQQQSAVDVAAGLARLRPTWFVTAGFSNSLYVRNWMCRYPVVLASPLENFRLHYGGNFLRERSTPAEQRAVAAALGEAFRLTMREEPFFGDGWQGPEGNADDAFRWATGTRATLYLPRFAARAATLRFRVMPLDHPSLPRQTMRVTLNGTALAQLTLASDARDYAVPAPATAWRDGVNEIVFDFGRARAPSTLYPGSTDSRELAASFDWIAVDDGADAPQFLLRLDTLIDRNTVWRHTPTRITHLDRATLTPLLGRLGYDPGTTWPLLARGHVHLEDLAESVAYGTECDDDPTFVQRAFAVLVNRAPTEVESRDLLARLGKGETRRMVARRILRAVVP
ncbi:MAG TPA: glycosyltransferase family 39 protein [Thermoanaerobaculia bacterium]|jgi:hypothetical protein